MKTKSILVLLGLVLLCQGIGGLGALFTYPEISGWYAALQKPSFNPPNWLFGPVWSTLYVLMAIGAWLVWKSPESPARKTALFLFGIQLAANSLWSFLFFKWHAPGAAFIHILFLWLLIAGWLTVTSRISKLAAWINLPYLAWVSFASVLNFWLWKLNA